MKLLRQCSTFPGLRSVSLLLLLGAMLTPHVALAEDEEAQAQREANFKAADDDGDGELNPEEFKAFIDANAEDKLGRAETIKRFGAYDRAFRQVDADDSGTVSWSEIMDRIADAD